MNRYLGPVLLVVIAVIVWILLPGPFIHGVIVGIFAALAALGGGLYLLGRVMAKRRGSKGLAPPPLPAGAWDYAMALTDLDGSPVTFADAAGRVIVLNFWATWCMPCVAELPSLQRLQAKTADLGVRFGFITTEDPAVVRRFLEKRQLDLPVCILSGEPPACFTQRGIPATYVIDKTGMIAWRHIGAAAWDAERVVVFVGGLAAGPRGTF